jgi:hypothetical protein
MPKPAYIICSHSGAIDQFTNVVSCFNIIEAASMKLPPESSGKPLLLRIVASWLMEENDLPTMSFEGQLLIRYADGQEIVVAEFPPFTFTKPVHRLYAQDFPLLGIPSFGIASIECRIRRQSEEEWIGRQSHSILLQAARDDDPPSSSDEPAPNPA